MGHLGNKFLFMLGIWIDNMSRSFRITENLDAKYRFTLWNVTQCQRFRHWWQTHNSIVKFYWIGLRIFQKFVKILISLYISSHKIFFDAVLIKVLLSVIYSLDTDNLDVLSSGQIFKKISSQLNNVKYWFIYENASVM